MARNLTPEEIDQLTKAYKQGGAGRWRTVQGGEGGDTSNFLENDYNVGGVNYRPIDGSKAVGGDSGYEESTGLQNYLSDAGNGMMNVYSPSGQYMGQVPKQKDSLLDKLVAASPYIGGALITAGGLGVGPLAGMGASGAGAGAGAAGLAELGVAGTPLGAGEVAATGLLEPGAAAASGVGAGGSELVGNGAGAFAPTEAAGSNLVGNGMGAFAPGTEVTTVATEGGLLGSAASAAKTAAGPVFGGSDLVKGAGLLAGVAAGSKPTTTTNTSQSRTDPRIDPYIYGDDGILKQAQQWQQANKTGLNPQMTRGLNTLTDIYTNPANMQGYKSMQNLGLGLMSSPIAGNPYTRTK